MHDNDRYSGTFVDAFHEQLAKLDEPKIRETAQNVRHVIAHRKLLPSDVVVGIDQTVKHKPEPEPVWYALEQLGVTRARAVFVGDSTHDMEAGRAAGVTTVAVLWGPYTRAQLTPTTPDYYADDFDALREIVASLSHR